MAKTRPGRDESLPSYSGQDGNPSIRGSGLHDREAQELQAKLQPGPTEAPGEGPRQSGIRPRPAGFHPTPRPDQGGEPRVRELERSWTGDPRDRDPASLIKGMPPNMGEGLIPHVISFQGIVSSVSRVYRPSDEALRDSWDNARFMRNDVVVMECVEQRQRSTALLDWDIEPDDEKNPEQVTTADEIKGLLENIPKFMQYRENLLHATWFGRYGIQHKFRWRMIRGQKRICVVNWLPIHGDKIVFRYDDGTREYNPDQVGIRVGTGFTTGDSLAKQWSVDRINKVEPTDYGLAYFLEKWERPLLALHKHYIEDGEYEDPHNAGRIHGIGLRSRIYWAWYQKQETLAALMQFLERSASGIEIWYYPFGNPEAEAATRKAAEERIGENRNMIMVPRPMGEDGIAYDVQRIEPGMAGAESMKDIVQSYFGHQIKRFILGQTLTSEAENTGLGSGLANIHLDTYMQIVRYDSRLLEETITNELIKPLINYNFPSMIDIPFRFKIRTEEADIESKLAAWKQAYDMGLEIPASDVGNMLGVRAPDKGEKILSLAAEQQQQEQMMQLGRGGGVGMPPRPGPQIGPATPGPNESAVGMGDSERRRRAKKNGNGVATPDEQGEDYDASAEIDDHRLSGQAARRQLLSTLDKRGAVLAQGQAPGERTRVLDYEGE